MRKAALFIYLTRKANLSIASSSASNPTTTPSVAPTRRGNCKRLRLLAQRIRLLPLSVRPRRCASTNGWRWTLPGLDQLGRPVCLIGHHLAVEGPDGRAAELYYQILDPALAGEALDHVDDMVLDVAREALPGAADGEALKLAMNQALGGKGLRIIRCRF